MQAELKKAAGLQHLQANAPDPHHTPLAATGAYATAVAPVVPEGLEKLYDALHGGDTGGHMTWARQARE